MDALHGESDWEDVPDEDYPDTGDNPSHDEWLRSISRMELMKVLGELDPSFHPWVDKGGEFFCSLSGRFFGRSTRVTLREVEAIEFCRLANELNSLMDQQELVEVRQAVTACPGETIEFPVAAADALSASENFGMPSQYDPVSQEVAPAREESTPLSKDFVLALIDGSINLPPNEWGRYFWIPYRPSRMADLRVLYEARRSQETYRHLDRVRKKFLDTQKVMLSASSTISSKTSRALLARGLVKGHSFPSPIRDPSRTYTFLKVYISDLSEIRPWYGRWVRERYPLPT